jgi:hypothetical protein
VVLQACQAAIVSSVEYSTMLASAAVGGALHRHRPFKRTLGSAAWATSMATSSGSKAIRRTGYRFVALGINFCDKRAQRQTCLSAAERSKNHVNNLFDYLIFYREAVNFLKIRKAIKQQ